jgi:hypothetical protein
MIAWIASMAACLPLCADTLIERRVQEADVLLMPKREGGPEAESACAVQVERPRTGDTIRLIAGERGARLEYPALTVIFRPDEQKIYFIYPREEKYSLLKLPIKAEEHDPEMSKLVGAELMRFREESRLPERAVTILERSLTRYEIVVGNKLRTKFRVAFALSPDPSPAGRMAFELQRTLHVTQFGSLGWLNLLPLEPGLPLLWQVNQILPSSEVVYREEAIKVEGYDPPPGAYEPPPGAQRIDHDRACLDIL